MGENNAVVWLSLDLEFFFSINPVMLSVYLPSLPPLTALPATGLPLQLSLLLICRQAHLHDVSFSKALSI